MNTIVYRHIIYLFIVQDILHLKDSLFEGNQVRHLRTRNGNLSVNEQIYLLIIPTPLAIYAIKFQYFLQQTSVCANFQYRISAVIHEKEGCIFDAMGT